MSVDPAGCAGRIVDIHGAAGVEWLERLPALVACWAERWELEVLPPFAGLSYHYVAPAVRADGTHVVIKASVPNAELSREIEALRYFDGEGICRLLEGNAAQGVMLLEWVKPGTPLSDVADDEQVTDAAVRVMRRLWRPAPVAGGEHGLATVAEWVADLDELRSTFGGGYGPFPPALVDRAAALFAELLSTASEATLIHGDMHPQNILKSERETWLAIDPKGVVGDPLYDVATFVNSVPEELPGAQRLAFVDRRVRQVAEALGLGRRRILDWAYAHAVLAGWWTYEDHGHGWEHAFGMAESLAAL